LSQLSATQYVAGTFPSWPRVRLIDIHRINDQWRVVFRWTDAGPEVVEIIDYHWLVRPNTAIE
jgi:hypothetical protein